MAYTWQNVPNGQLVAGRPTRITGYISGSGYFDNGEDSGSYDWMNWFYDKEVPFTQDRVYVYLNNGYICSNNHEFSDWWGWESHSLGGFTVQQYFDVFFTATLVCNNGESNKTLTDTNGVFIKPQNPSRTGYTFKGWFTNAACTQAYNWTTAAANIVLYAGWTINSYKMSFDSKGGSGVSSQTKTYGSVFTQPNNPTRTGYTFEGWFTNADCTNAYIWSTLAATNITLYAKWTKEFNKEWQNVPNGQLIDGLPTRFSGQCTSNTKSSYDSDSFYEVHDLENQELPYALVVMQNGYLKSIPDYSNEYGDWGYYELSLTSLQQLLPIKSDESKPHHPQKSFSCGSASAAVNLFNGRLVYGLDGLSVDGETGVSYFYNSSQDPSLTTAGQGWKLSAMQYIYAKDGDFIFCDASGNCHTFRKLNTTTYYDTSGLGLYYYPGLNKITNKADNEINVSTVNEMIFNNNGRLTQIKTGNGIEKNFVYDSNSNLTRIYNSNNADKDIVISYSGGKINEIVSPIQKLICTYEGANLKSIKKQVGTHEKTIAEFSYNNGKLKYVLDNESGDMLEFAYNTDTKVSFVGIGHGNLNAFTQTDFCAISYERYKTKLTNKDSVCLQYHFHNRCDGTVEKITELKNNTERKIQQEDTKTKLKLTGSDVSFYLEDLTKIYYNTTSSNIDTYRYFTESDIMATCHNIYKARGNNGSLSNPFVMQFNNGAHKIIVDNLNVYNMNSSFRLNMNSCVIETKLSDNARINNRLEYLTSETLSNNYSSACIKQITQALVNGETSCQYVWTDFNGKTLKKQDEYGVSEVYYYDSLGNLTKTEVLPSGALTGIVKSEYQYYSDGNLKKAISPDGSSVTYNYNNNGLLQNAQYDNCGAIATESYTYDEFNEKITSINLSGATQGLTNNLWYNNGSLYAASPNNTQRHKVEFSRNSTTDTERFLFNNNPTLTNTNNRQTKNISKTFGNETISGYYNSYGQSTSESFNGLTSEFTYTPAHESELSVKPDTIYDAYENSTIKYTYNADKELIRFEKFNGKNDFSQTQRKAYIAMNADRSFSYGKNHNAITTTKITRDSSKFITPRVNENEITLTNKTLKAAYLYDNYGRLSSSQKYSLALPNISRLDEALIYDSLTPAITRQELKNLGSVGKFRVDTDYTYNKGCLTSKNSQFWNAVNSQINSFTHNHSYNYDAFNRIISEQTIDKNYIYAYNNEGNLSGISGSITRSFEHTDGRLTSINGTAVAYNDYGNPTSYKGNVINWTRGTLLKKYGSSIEYSYNLEGVRYQKTVNGVTTSYDYDGHKLLREDRGGEDVLIYLYDATGIMGVMHRKNNIETVYYYLKDILGNIIGITLDDKIVAAYDYNAFGECIDIKAYDLSTMQATTDPNHIAFINPFRWKSYYFDTDTGLFSIGPRYYDPEIGRWISPDDIEVATSLGATTINGLNLYSYCQNNPVNMVDHSGMWPTGIQGLLTYTERFFTSLSDLCNILTKSGPKIIGHTTKIGGIGRRAAQRAENLAHAQTVKMGKTFGTIAKVAAFVTLGIDMGISIYNDIQNGASFGTIATHVFDIGAKFAIGWGITAAFSALIPIPFLGTAIGIGVSLLVDYLIDNAGGVTQILTNIGNSIGNAAQSVANFVSNGWNNFVNGWNNFWSFSWI